MRARRWLAVIGRAASPSETARVNIVAQVREEVKWPKIKSLKIDSECGSGGTSIPPRGGRTGVLRRAALQRRCVARGGRSSASQSNDLICRRRRADRPASRADRVRRPFRPCLRLATGRVLARALRGYAVLCRGAQGRGAAG